MENMSHSEEDECYIEKEENENGNDKTTDGKEAAVLSANDFLNQQFVSYEEAYECYVRYAKCVRFGVRKGDAAADSIGNYVRHKFLYNRADEQTKSYKWLLDNFSEVMMNKHQSLVIMDGDNAMKSAIEEVFPNATHRLCAWHLYKNVVSHIKDPEFQKQYRMKEQWAIAYLSSKFCVVFRTTSRCEGINSFIKSFVDSRDSILALVQNLERALRDYKNNEIVAEFKTINGEHVPTTGLHSLERRAVSVYIREIFWKILKEIKSVAALDIVWFGSCSTTSEYKIIKYGRPDHEYIVLYDQDTQKMVCQCQRWDSYGIPCSHMFCVMKWEQIKELPETLVLKRWTKDVKKFDNDQGNINGKQDEERSILMRIGALLVASSRMLYLGGRKFSHFRYTMNEICRVKKHLEAKLEQTKQLMS
ncbi:hypothetical protein AHAS_Ahas11G0236500 [Arachis hypogaea]